MDEAVTPVAPHPGFGAPDEAVVPELADELESGAVKIVVLAAADGSPPRRFGPLDVTMAPRCPELARPDPLPDATEPSPEGDCGRLIETDDELLLGAPPLG
jgi:hypothetical protein